MSKLRGNSNTNRTRTQELCDHCGVTHKISKDVPDGCIGKAVSTGKMTKQAATKFFSFLTNPDGAVLPGQYVRVKIEGLARFGVLAVPELALTQGLMGPLVYVLDDDNVARAFWVLPRSAKQSNASKPCVGIDRHLSSPLTPCCGE